MSGIELIVLLGEALFRLKNVYDQHKEKKQEIKKLQDFIDQFQTLKSRIQSNPTGTAVLLKNLTNKFESATAKLKYWSTNQNFFSKFNSSQRLKELQNLRQDVTDAMLATIIFLFAERDAQMFKRDAQMFKEMKSQRRIMEENFPNKQKNLTTVVDSSKTSRTRVVRDSRASRPGSSRNTRHAHIGSGHDQAAAQCTTSSVSTVITPPSSERTLHRTLRKQHAGAPKNIGHVVDHQGAASQSNKSGSTSISADASFSMSKTRIITRSMSKRSRDSWNSMIPERGHPGPSERAPSVPVHTRGTPGLGWEKVSRVGEPY